MSGFLDNYNTFQQIALIKKAANLPQITTGSEDSLRAALTETIGKTLNGKTLQRYDWSLAWGPQVWKNDPSTEKSPADNAWFVNTSSELVINGTKKQTYVVAIAGTAAKSTYDWKVEDTAVDQVVDFQNWYQSWQSKLTPPTGTEVSGTTTKPFVALGTSIGVFQVLSNAAAPKSQGAGSTLYQFLKNLSGDVRVVFTGHSLGGALAPTVALGMVASGALSRINNPSSNVLVVPSAGASPGESNFSNLFNHTFPQSSTNGYQTFNADLFNTRDIVPQAWSTDASKSPERNLDNILKIYPDLNPIPAKLVSDGITKEKNSAKLSGIIYNPIQGVSFEGKVPDKPVKTIEDFVAQLAIQHLTAYQNYIFEGGPPQANGPKAGIADLYSDFVDTAGVNRLNVIQAARLFPVARYLSESDFSDEAEDIFPFDVLREP